MAVEYAVACPECGSDAISYIEEATLEAVYRIVERRGSTVKIEFSNYDDEYKEVENTYFCCEDCGNEFELDVEVVE